MQNPFVKWGLIAALFTIVVSLIGYLVSDELLVQGTLGWLTIPALFFCATKAALEERSLNGGYISLGKAFGSALFAIVIAITLISIFNFLLFNFIDTGLQEIRMDKMMETAEKMGGGMDDEQMEMYSQMMGSPVSIFFMELIGGVLCTGLIPALIIGLIVQRQNPNNDLL